MPVWQSVELGWPFTEGASAGGRRILPDEIRSAVWHAIIAGARGVLYFDHNFGPNTPDSTILGQGYADNRAMAKSVNAQIKALAPVLNSPFVTSGHSATDTINGDVRYMVKWSGGKFNLFRGRGPGRRRRHLLDPVRRQRDCGQAGTLEPAGRGGQHPRHQRVFTDSFADKNSPYLPHRLRLQLPTD
jgi:hypothetical protein